MICINKCDVHCTVYTDSEGCYPPPPCHSHCGLTLSLFPSLMVWAGDTSYLSAKSPVHILHAYAKFHITAYFRAYYWHIFGSFCIFCIFCILGFLFAYFLHIVHIFCKYGINLHKQHRICLKTASFYITSSL